MFSTHNKDMITQTLPNGRGYMTLAQSLQPSSPANELQSHYLGVVYGDCNREQFVPYFIKELGRLLDANHMPPHSTTEDSICFTIHGWHVSMSLTGIASFRLKNEQGTVTCNNVSELISTLNTVYF